MSYSVFDDGESIYDEDDRSPTTHKMLLSLGALVLIVMGGAIFYKGVVAQKPVVNPLKLSTELINDSSRKLVRLMNETSSRYGYFDDCGKGFHTIPSLDALVEKITTVQSDVYEFVGPNDRCTLHIDYETTRKDRVATAVSMLQVLLKKLIADLSEGEIPLKIIVLTANRDERVSYHIHLNRIFKNLKVMKYFLLEKSYDKQPFSEFIDWNIYKHRYGRLFRCLNQYKKYPNNEFDPNSVLRPLDPNQSFKPVETLVKYLDESCEVVYDMFDDQVCPHH